jgi:hypothetical protein
VWSAAHFQRSQEGRAWFIFTAIDARPSQPSETTFYIRHSVPMTSPRRQWPGAAGRRRRVPIAAMRSLESRVASEQALSDAHDASDVVRRRFLPWPPSARAQSSPSRTPARGFGLRIALGASASVGGGAAGEFAGNIGLAIGFLLSVAVSIVMAPYGITPTTR